MEKSYDDLVQEITNLQTVVIPELKAALKTVQDNIGSNMFTNINQVSRARDNARIISAADYNTYIKDSSYNLYVYCTDGNIHPITIKDEDSHTIGCDRGYTIIEFSKNNVNTEKYIKLFAATDETLYTVTFDSTTITAKLNEGFINSGTKVRAGSTVEFNANTGYKLISWYDDSTTCPKSVVINDDFEMTGTFEQVADLAGKLYINEIDANGLSEYGVCIELYNESTEQISLAGVKLLKAKNDDFTDSLKILEFTEDLCIPANDRFIVRCISDQQEGHVIPNTLNASISAKGKLALKLEDSSERTINEVINTENYPANGEYCNFENKGTLMRETDAGLVWVVSSYPCIGKPNEIREAIADGMFIQGSQLILNSDNIGGYDTHILTQNGIAVKVKPSNWEFKDGTEPYLTTEHMCINYAKMDFDASYFDYSSDVGYSKAKKNAKALFPQGNAILLNNGKTPDVIIPDDLGITHFTVKCCGHKKSESTLLPDNPAYLTGGGTVTADSVGYTMLNFALTDVQPDILTYSYYPNAPEKPDKWAYFDNGIYDENRPKRNYRLKVGGAKVWAEFTFYNGQEAIDGITDADGYVKETVLDEYTKLTAATLPTINELSGFCFNADKSKLYAVGDSGTINEITLNNENNTFSYTELFNAAGSPLHHDYEGITLFDNKLYIAVEGSSDTSYNSFIGEYDVDTNEYDQIGIIYSIMTENGSGLEGIAYFESTYFLIGNQDKPNLLYLWDSDSESIIAKSCNGRNYEVSDLYYDTVNKELWLLDKSDWGLVHKYKLTVDYANESIDMKLLASYKLQLAADETYNWEAKNPESLAIDTENRIMYIGTENTGDEPNNETHNAQLFKFKY